MLFRVNTVFEITSTLHACSDIGKFYGRVDNIAMKEVMGRQPGQKAGPAPGPASLLWSTSDGLSNLLLSIPEEAYAQVLGHCLPPQPPELSIFCGAGGGGG